MVCDGCLNDIFINSNCIGVLIRKKNKYYGINNKSILLKSCKTLTSKIGRRLNRNIISYISVEKDSINSRGFYPYHVHMVLENISMNDSNSLLQCLSKFIKGNNQWLRNVTKSLDPTIECLGVYGKVGLHPIYDANNFINSYLRKHNEEDFDIYTSHANKHMINHFKGANK